MKKIQTEPPTAERYRLQVSDGASFQPCMLATQMNQKIANGEMDKFSVVRVLKYLCNTIHDRKSAAPVPTNLYSVSHTSMYYC